MNQGDFTGRTGGRLAGYSYLALTIFLFSTVEVASRMVGASIHPVQLNFLRFFLGGILLFAVLAFRGNLRIRRRDLAAAIFLGIMNVPVAMNLLHLGVAMPGARASNLALIFSINPVFVVLFSLFMEGEKPDRRCLAGILLSVTGLIIFFSRDLKSGFSFQWSELIVLSSSVIFALYTYLARRLSLSIGSLKMNAYGFLLGSLTLLPFLFLFGVPVFTIDAAAVPFVLYLGVFVSGLSYLTYFKGLGIIGAGKGSLVFFVKPGLAALLAWMLLGEELTPIFIAGMLLIVGGIGLSSFPASKVNRP